MIPFVIKRSTFLFLKVKNFPVNLPELLTTACIIAVTDDDYGLTYTTVIKSIKPPESC